MTAISVGAQVNGLGGAVYLLRWHIIAKGRQRRRSANFLVARYAGHLAGTLA